MKVIKDRIDFVILMFKRRSIKELIFKNIDVFFGYPLYLLSFLFHRNNDKWVFGSHVGFSGNPKYFFIYSCKEKHREKCYWIASSKTEARIIKDFGFKSYYRWSIAGLYHSLTAGVYIYSFHLIDINFWTSGGVKKVNLWHGVGIKNIEFKSSTGSAKKVYDTNNIFSRIYLPYLFHRPDVFNSTSLLMTDHFCECFRIKESNCIEFGYPRCDIFTWSEELLLDFIDIFEGSESRELVRSLQEYEKVYLYMPTWRETRYDFITSSGLKFDELDEILQQKNEVFLLKLHPATNLSFESLKTYKNIIQIDKGIDIYPILPFTNVLITDYSSIYYDYIKMKEKNVILFPFDYDEYITNNRDLAFNYNDYTPGVRVNDAEALLACIRNDHSLFFPERKWIIEKFWANEESNASSLIYDYLV
ncbi:CDP-glycerol glycerophosphotransferase family protein [Ancylomarina sp. 16SWW S1-10-2]|uniref:CDP-glycerol glycerophosphotransferase family protein n=1 Tax=Ancylomarina sp. 16SWW S1-10-2 TaxID=2499681 RepID=UPI0012ADFB1D|nr:CDP-glycerol glycerophosphotransferase family protein [Ancylomarina sp. 16SWW S1-10-2]MRT94804.1 hypothetical protein [Ancylomarina sp. 16SWW S1-10-2]